MPIHTRVKSRKDTGSQAASEAGDSPRRLLRSACERQCKERVQSVLVLSPMPGAIGGASKGGAAKNIRRPRLRSIKHESGAHRPETTTKPSQTPPSKKHARKQQQALCAVVAATQTKAKRTHPWALHPLAAPSAHRHPSGELQSINQDDEVVSCLQRQQNRQASRLPNRQVPQRHTTSEQGCTRWNSRCKIDDDQASKQF